MAVAKCPYCDAELNPKPKRKKKCPVCGKPIYVRKGKLLTEEEAAIEEWLNYLRKFDIDRKEFDSHREKLSQQFGFTASVHDTVWRILNTVAGKTRDLQQRQWAYSEMARLAWREGKSPLPYQKEAARAELLLLQAQGVKEVYVVNAGFRDDDPSTCQACRKLHGQKFSIEEALETLPVPTVCENAEGCRCGYVSESTWNLVNEFVLEK